MSRSPFDPTGDLPQGRVLLEASAGTGKTWTIAALALRYVAEAAIPLDQMLVVTFTRAATSELRDRVRTRLSSAHRFLSSNFGPLDTDDAVLGHLASCGEAERSVRVNRVDAALRSFDRATIATLHGFAHRLLIELGLLARSPRIRELVGDPRPIVEDVVLDAYIRRFADVVDDETPSLKDLNELAHFVVTNPDAGIQPAPGQADETAALRSDIAHEVRAALAERAGRSRTITYDALLMRAWEALADPAVGGYARRLIGRRFRVGLIDEFQDTDRIQWDIVDALFPAPSTMIVIGDPKQSIYAFRGADVGAYLTVADAAADEHTLSTSWRSDGPLIQAFDSLFGGVSFGDDRIRYLPVTPAPGRDGPGITGVEAPLIVRMVGRSAPVRRIKNQTLSAPAARRFIAADVASYVVGLAEGAELADPGRAVTPGDIAVLCRTGAEVDLVRGVLNGWGIPAVVGRTGSVFTSQAAEGWAALLAALELPQSTRRVRAAALTPFFGWSVADLGRADDDALLPLQHRITGWADRLRDRGVPAVWREIERTEEVSARVLSRVGGERLATDLDHLTELLHAAHRSGARSLHSWLASEMQRARREPEGEESMARRLETDADAVHVLTAHSAKGLEFPVVLCPFLWKPPAFPIRVPVHHGTDDGTRVVAVGGDTWDGHAEAVRLATEESAGEEMRLAYVALTRARHHVVVWWAMCEDTQTAPLTRMLFGRTDDGLREKVALVSDDRIASHLQPVIDRSAATIGLVRVTEEATPRSLPTARSTPAALDRARFGRGVDMTWRRTSFTGITAGVHPSVAADPPPTVTLDETPDAEPPPTVPTAVLPMADLPGGVGFGTLVHAVLESVDLSHPDLESILVDVCREMVRRHGSAADPLALATGISAVAATPVVDGTGGWALRDVDRGDLLAEMEFEMPLAVGGRPITTAAIADVLEDRLAADHPLHPYAERLRDMRQDRFRGFLTGSVDAVIRAGDPMRYWVVDYKTNRLTPPGETPSPADYAPELLDEAMMHGDYVLQSLLYQVALDRFLRARLDRYDPASHLGGSFYLFVRGMIGPDTPGDGDGRYGIHRWDADPLLLSAVGELFERRVS